MAERRSEKVNMRVEVKPARLLKDPQKLADVTGGVMVSQDGIPWRVSYRSGDLLWAGHPKKQPGVHESTPFLEVKFPRPYGHSLGVDVVVLTEQMVMFVSPGFTDDKVISGYTFSHGDFSEFRMPIGIAGDVLVKARDAAREESQKFTDRGRKRLIIRHT